MRADKTLSVLAGLVVLATCGFTVAAMAQAPGRTVWDGVYTAEQATRGAAVYAQRCSACHGDSLGGIDVAPALAGPSFLNNWNGTSVADLYNRIEGTMPLEEPGALTPRQTADVMAYIIQRNGVPAGAAPLASNPQLLAGTAIRAQRR